MIDGREEGICSDEDGSFDGTPDGRGDGHVEGLVRRGDDGANEFDASEGKDDGSTETAVVGRFVVFVGFSPIDRGEADGR